MAIKIARALSAWRGNLLKGVRNSREGRNNIPLKQVQWFSK